MMAHSQVHPIPLQVDPLHIDIDKSLPTPAYLQLTEQLKQAIQTRVLRAGSALPSERELATRLGLSRMTVRKALEELVATHYIEQRHGSGTYVLGKRLEQPVEQVQGFTDEARALGFKPGSVLLDVSKVQASSEVATALALNEGDTVLRISRLRTADDEPLALQLSHLIPDYAELSIDLLKTEGSLYQTLEAQFGVVPSGAKQAVSARLPTAHEQTILAIGEHLPILALTRTTFLQQGVPFEYVQSAYRSDRYRMLLELTS
jgi:GntR family transcriptional regulator